MESTLKAQYKRYGIVGKQCLTCANASCTYSVNGSFRPYVDNCEANSNWETVNEFNGYCKRWTLSAWL